LDKTDKVAHRVIAFVLRGATAGLSSSARVRLATRFQIAVQSSWFVSDASYHHPNCRDNWHRFIYRLPALLDKPAVAPSLTVNLTQAGCRVTFPINLLCCAHRQSFEHVFSLTKNKRRTTVAATRTSTHPTKTPRRVVVPS
jgi:hypothetical protein